MTDAEALQMLVEHGWSWDRPGALRSPFRRWELFIGPNTVELFFGQTGVVRRGLLADVLRAEMPGSASVTVATYFGLRAPGVV
jgi:hypothetical protein